MAEQTYYRYVGKDGNAHLTDDLSSIPKEHRDSAQPVALHQLITTAMAKDSARHLVQDMHWPSFAIGFGAAAVVAIAMRLFMARRLVFAGVAAVIAAGGFGTAGFMHNLSGKIPGAEMLSGLAQGTVGGTLPITPAEARRILESLPKSHADRATAAEKASQD